MPALSALALSAPRASSSSVMSASSNWVTCGRLTQLACSREPEMRCTRPIGLMSIGTELREIRHGDFRQRRRRPRRRRAPAAGAHQRLDERLDVVVGDAALLARAPDAAQIDAKFACKLAHRRAGMGAREAAFIDGRDSGFDGRCRNGGRCNGGRCRNGGRRCRGRGERRAGRWRHGWRRLGSTCRCSGNRRRRGGRRHGPGRNRCGSGGRARRAPDRIAGAGRDLQRGDQRAG